MADKQATIRVTADSRGFLASVRKMTKAGGAIGASIGAGIADRTKAAVRSVADALRGLARIRPEKGWLAGIREWETRALMSARRVAGALARTTGRGVGAAARWGVDRMAEGGKAAVGATKGALAAAAAGGLATATKLTFDAAGVQEKANRLSISARASGDAAIDPKILEAEFYAVAKDIKGISADAVADAAAAFVSLTGDLTTARSSMRDFAVVSTATGADLKDVAETAASISTQFGITDANQIRDVLAALTFQGKAGSFELKDAAAQFQKLAASGAAFGLRKDVEGVKTLGGLTQIARSGTGSGEQAATAVESLFSALQSKTKQLQAAGIKVYGKSGEARDVREILAQTISKVGGTDMARKQQGLVAIFGDQGKRAINPLINLFAETFRTSKGSTKEKQDAAFEAIREKLYSASDAAGAWGEVVRDSAQAQETNSAKLANAWQKLQSAAADKLLPVVTEMISKLADSPEVIEAAVMAIEMLADGLTDAAFYAKMISEGKTVEETARTVGAERLRRKAERGKKELSAMQMSPDEIAELEKSDPSKLSELRTKALMKKIEIDAAESVATQEEQKVLVSQATRGGFAIQAEGRTTDIISKMISTLKAAQQDTQIKGEVKVRVVNADDIKPSSTAPTPGYAPR